MSELKEEIVLNDDELICVLTGDKKKANAKEQMLQSVILQMNEEYGYEMRDMKRDYAFSYEDEEGIYIIMEFCIYGDLYSLLHIVKKKKVYV